jgi:uncharacterized membrane protein YgdD (TMEM256/DUF423 family)
LLAALAVGLGAFGAHGLRAKIGPQALEVWHTAVQYHFWNSLGVLAIGLAAFHLRNGWISVSGWLLVAGIVVFCGSLYALALGAPRALGMVTPLGGLALILGWLGFSLAALRG